MKKRRKKNNQEITNKNLSYIYSFQLGWFCKMLRDHRRCDKSNLCGKNCLQEAHDEAQSEGQDVPRNSDSSGTKPPECCWIS